eukprot:364640-Chlamydomonas_euryale.AAC.21
MALTVSALRASIARKDHRGTHCIGLHCKRAWHEDRQCSNAWPHPLLQHAHSSNIPTTHQFKK